MSKLPYELFLALRYFRPKGTYVSVITLIAVVGVMLAVGVLIVVISVMTGFDRDLKQKILGFNAHLRVVQAGDVPLQKYAAVMTNLQAMPHVKGVAPFVFGQVLVETEPNYGSPKAAAPMLRGVEASLEDKVSILPKSIKQGEFNLEGRSVIVGRGFAASIGVSVGDRLAISGPSDLEKMRHNQGKDKEQVVPPRDFKITGIFDVGHFEYDNSVIIVSLENAQDIYNLEDDVHGLMVMVDDPFKVDEMRRTILQRLGPRYFARTWMEDNEVILNALVVEKQAMFVVLFVVMIVAAFGIMGTQIAFVFQKTREIGILKALGSTQGQIAWLFLSQSFMVGLLGVTAGLGFGLTLLYFRNPFLRVMNDLTGIDLFPASLYTFNQLPALTIPMDVLIICGSAMVLCVLAGVLPAWRAARLHPVEALRYE